MRPSGAGKTRILFLAPSRGLIGYQSQFLTDTRGTGLMNRIFDSYGPYKGDIAARRNGALISTDKGDAVAYSIWKLQDRGMMFIGHNDKVYAGMVVGEHSRENDLEINVIRGKQLTNVRASGADEAVVLVPPKKMSMEEMMSYINEDELVEVTPKSLRLRKRYLDSNARERAKKEAKKA
jgi:GTP-binding protein